MLRTTASRLLLPALTGSLIAAGIALPTSASAVSTAWSPLSQVTAPDESTTASFLTTTPDGLAELYLDGEDLEVRRHTVTGWSASTLVQADQALDLFTEPTLAASATRTFAVSESGTDADFVTTLTTLDAAGVVQGSAVVANDGYPSLAALPDGTGVITSIDETTGSVRAATISSAGVVSGYTTLATPANGSYYAVALTDKDDQAVVVWDDCSDVDCAAASLKAKTLVSGVWSAPVTIATNVGDIALTGGSGGDKMMLTYLETSAASFQTAGRAIVNSGGTWGSITTVPVFGAPMIAPDGLEVVASGLGDVAYRTSSSAAWTVGPDGPVPGDDCNYGSMPALEAGTLVSHAPVPAVLPPGGCRLVESRFDLTTPAAVADSTAPTLNVTSAPPAYTNAPGASVAFTASDTSGEVTTTCRLDAAAFSTCTSPVDLPTLANGQHTLSIAVRDSSGNWSTAYRSWITDRVAPLAGMSSPNFTPVLGGGFTAVWNGVDNAGGSGVASYDVAIHRAGPNGAFGPWSAPASLQNTTVKSTAVSVPVGGTACMSVRSHDRAGNTSAWSAERCAIAPLDDRNLALGSSGWSRPANGSAYRQTLSGTTGGGQTLRSGTVQTSRLALVAVRCSTCGSVAVYVGNTLLANVNLYSASTSYRNVINLPRFSLRSTVVTIRSTSTGKAVWVDGLLTSRV